MNDIANDILQSIEKHLPSQMSDVLKDRLEHLASVERDYENLRSAYDTLQFEHAHVKSCMKDLSAELEEYEKKSSAIDSLKKELENMHNSLQHKTEILELKEKHAAEKCNLMLTLYKIPFENRRLRESLIQQTPVHHEELIQGDYDNRKQCYERHIVRSDNTCTLETTKEIEEK